MLLSHGERCSRPVDLKRRIFRKVPRGTDGRGPRGSADAGDRPTSRAGCDQLRTRGASTPARWPQIVRRPRTACWRWPTSRPSTLFGLAARDLGRPFQDLEISYRPVELRRVHRAGASRAPHRRVAGTSSRPAAAARSPASTSRSCPLVDATGGLLGVSVTFHDVTAHRRLQDELRAGQPRSCETAYEELQSTNEELETTNEELQSTVEELETTNEELQSTNEELETMNEELQSTNDELQTINDELRDRSDELDRRQRLPASRSWPACSAGVVVVDRDLRGAGLEPPGRGPLGAAAGRGRRASTS